MPTEASVQARASRSADRPERDHFAMKIAASPAPSVIDKSFGPLACALPVPSALVQLVMPLLERLSELPGTVRLTAAPRLIATTATSFRR